MKSEFTGIYTKTIYRRFHYKKSGKPLEKLKKAKLSLISLDYSFTKDTWGIFMLIQNRVKK